MVGLGQDVQDFSGFSILLISRIAGKGKKINLSNHVKDLSGLASSLLSRVDNDVKEESFFLIV